MVACRFFGNEDVQCGGTHVGASRGPVRSGRQRGGLRGGNEPGKSYQAGRYRVATWFAGVARFGGFLAQKVYGEPGRKTIWRAMQLILEFVAGIGPSCELQAQGLVCKESGFISHVVVLTAVYRAIHL